MHFNAYLCFMQIEIFNLNICSPANVILIYISLYGTGY